MNQLDPHGQCPVCASYFPRFYELPPTLLCLAGQAQSVHLAFKGPQYLEQGLLGSKSEFLGSPTFLSCYKSRAAQFHLRQNSVASSCEPCPLVVPFLVWCCPASGVGSYCRVRWAVPGVCSKSHQKPLGEEGTDIVMKSSLSSSVKVN